jgi:hypothetical protein
MFIDKYIYRLHRVELRLTAQGAEHRAASTCRALALLMTRAQVD